MPISWQLPAQTRRQSADAYAENVYDPTMTVPKVLRSVTMPMPKMEVLSPGMRMSVPKMNWRF